MVLPEVMVQRWQVIEIRRRSVRAQVVVVQRIQVQDVVPEQMMVRGRSSAIVISQMRHLHVASDPSDSVIPQIVGHIVEIRVVQIIRIVTPTQVVVQVDQVIRPVAVPQHRLVVVVHRIHSHHGR